MSGDTTRRESGAVAIGVIGCGFIGSLHAANASALPGARLAAVADADPERAKRVAEQNGAAYWSRDPDELIGDPKIDAIIVATPVHTHFDYALKVHRAGKHLLLEKPATPSLERTVALMRSLEELRSGKLTYVNFKFRHAPALRRAVEHVGRAQVSSIQVAAPRVPDVHSMFDPGNGGYLLDCGVHAMDMLLRLHPAGKVRVQAESRTLFHPRSDAPDTAAATLRFEDGSLAAFVLHDAICAPFASKWLLQGYRDGRAAVVHQNVRRAELSRAAGGAGEAQAEQLRFDDVDELRLSLESFVSSIATGEPLAATLADAARAQALVEAVRESAATGRAVEVDLSGI